jgi:hypothetical protein
MADTVKTSVLKAVRAAIRRTQGMGDVVLNPFQSLDLETVRMPAAFVYDGTVDRERRNRTVRVTMPLQIDIWCKKDGDTHELGDDADELAGRMEKAITEDEDVRLWCSEIVPGPSGAFTTDDQYGGVALQYTIQFQHVWGDPFDHGRAE